MKIELAKDDVRLILTYKEWSTLRMAKNLFDNTEVSEYKEKDSELNDPDLPGIEE